MVEVRAVTEDEADIRLDRWFRRHFPGVAQSAIQKACRVGQIRVDGKRVEASLRLEAGQSVRVPPMPAGPLPPPKPSQLEALGVTPELRRELEAMVLYRDDHLIVHADRGSFLGAD